MGAGMGGQSAQMPFSAVRSRLRMKKGATSDMPALVTVFLPQVLKMARALAASRVPSLGARGWCARLAMVLISLWKWYWKGPWKEDIISWSLEGENADGEGREVR